VTNEGEKKVDKWKMGKLFLLLSSLIYLRQSEHTNLSNKAIKVMC